MEVGLPAPDAVFFLRLSIEAAAKRGGYGLERYEEEKFQQEVSRAGRLEVFQLVCVPCSSGARRSGVRC